MTFPKQGRYSAFQVRTISKRLDFLVAIYSMHSQWPILPSEIPSELLSEEEESEINEENVYPDDNHDSNY